MKDEWPPIEITHKGLEDWKGDWARRKQTIAAPRITVYPALLIIRTFPSSLRVYLFVPTISGHPCHPTSSHTPFQELWLLIPLTPSSWMAGPEKASMAFKLSPSHTKCAGSLEDRKRAPIEQGFSTSLVPWFQTKLNLFPRCSSCPVPLSCCFLY